jgi:arginyl-tRNA synthetase
MIKEDIKGLIQKACADLHFEVGEIALEHPENPEHGDYSTNVALVLAKQLQRNPSEVAEEVRDRILNTRYKYREG